MPGHARSSAQPLTWPVEHTRAIELGFGWLVTPRRPHHVTNGSQAYALLALVHGLIAAGMAARVVGDVPTAWEHLQKAGLLLPAGLTRPDHARGERRAVLAVPPPREDPLVWATHRTVRALWREQEGLARLRRRFEHERGAEAEYTDAAIEYLCRVEFVPTWVDENSRPAAFCPEPSRDHFHRRVNQLRRFADPTAGDLGVGAWRTMGGYRGLRAAALRELAAAPSATEWPDGPLTREVPVDYGRQTAWTVARQGHVTVAALGAGAQG